MSVALFTKPLRLRDEEDEYVEQMRKQFAQRPRICVPGAGNVKYPNAFSAC